VSGGAGHGVKLGFDDQDPAGNAAGSDDERRCAAPFDPDILEVGKEPAPGFVGAADPEAVDVLLFIEGGDDEPSGDPEDSLVTLGVKLEGGPVDLAVALVPAEVKASGGVGIDAPGGEPGRGIGVVL
jgi:hypothetical protein